MPATAVESLCRKDGGCQVHAEESLSTCGRATRELLTLLPAKAAFDASRLLLCRANATMISSCQGDADCHRRRAGVGLDPHDPTAFRYDEPGFALVTISLSPIAESQPDPRDLTGFRFLACRLCAVCVLRMPGIVAKAGNSAGAMPDPRCVAARSVQLCRAV